MGIIRCPRCKNKYEYMGVPSKLCPECSIKEEATYQTVRKYVKENPGATVFEVSEALGVSRTKILQYLREERLEVSPTSTTFLMCSSCGQAITTGIYCDSCRKRYDVSSPPSHASAASSKAFRDTDASEDSQTESSSSNPSVSPVSSSWKIKNDSTSSNLYRPNKKGL